MTDTFLDQKSLTSSAQSRFDHMLFERLPIGLAVCDMEGQLGYINEAFAAIIGYSVNQALKLTYWELTPIEFEGQEQEQLASLQETGRYGPYEKEYIHKDGHRVPVRLSGVLIRENNQDYIWSSVEDITRRKRAEEALTRANRVLTAMSDCSAALIQARSEQELLSEICRLVVETGGYRLAWVGYAEDNEEKSVRPVSSYGINDGYVENVKAAWGDTERGRGPVGACVRSGKPSVIQDDLLDSRFLPWREGAIKRGFGSTGSFPLLNKGQPFGVFSFYAGEANAFDKDEVRLLTDLTNNLAYGIMALRQAKEREHAANALLEAKQEAEQANLAKTKFLAAASHDLRQPLQAANLFLYALGTKEHQPESREIISNIEASIGSLDNLLNSLLDISRLEAGLIKPHVQPLSISKMMERLTKEYSLIAENEGVEIKSVETKAAVYTDPVLLESILRNLLSNAIKNADHGKVLLGCRRNGDSITLEVWDNGCGIPEDRLSDIFGEFVQIGNEGRDRRKGLGLGLSIVEKVAGLLDHRIAVRSWEGRGSAFTIELPLALDKVVPDQSEEAPVAVPPKKVSVFIIEDEDAIRSSLSLVLEQKGYEVHATSGLDCPDCDHLTSEVNSPPDIIIADFRLQNGKTGIEAISCLRETFKKDISAILLTGDTAPERLVEAKKSGLPILHKPIKVDDLLLEMAKAIKAEETTPRIS